jgi:hypothetical protein
MMYSDTSVDRARVYGCDWYCCMSRRISAARECLKKLMSGPEGCGAGRGGRTAGEADVEAAESEVEVDVDDVSGVWAARPDALDGGG